jgi:putative nucleotide binding protein
MIEVGCEVKPFWGGEWMRGYEHDRRGRIEKGRGEVRQKRRETYARVLDYLPYGHPNDSRPVYQKKPLVHAVGEDQFVLMELSPKKDKIPAVYDRAYIGEGEREEIDHVTKRLRYEELTPTAKVELPYVLEIIVKENEERFMKAFNDAKPITTRLHTLDLLPGIGKKLMWAIVEERKKGAFSNFEDLMKRVKGLHHPEKILAKRIEEEITEENIKYKLFTS